MAVKTEPRTLQALQIMARRLRRHSITSTAAAGSGHPTSCMSCADLIAALFFKYLRYDINQPKNLHNDRFVLSKGHAAPILWAAWAEAGAFPVEHLEGLRRFTSTLEGHPTVRNPLVDVATGSLGQGLSVGVGMALAARLDRIENRVWVLMGDGETAEGSVWEAAMLAAHEGLERLTAIVDINRLGQSEPTMYEHDVESYRRRFEAFGWHARVIDGHDIEEIIDACDEALAVRGRPQVILARTLKGKGVSFLENTNGFHGKPVDEDKVEAALAELGGADELPEPLNLAQPEGHAEAPTAPAGWHLPPPEYPVAKPAATREAFGVALRKLAEVHPGVVALDGDVKNSTYTEKLEPTHPERLFECYIAEQNMVGAAMGMAALGKVPFAATFACFLERACDQIRIAGMSRLNVKFCGSHVGVSIGEDGPSQMALEDLAFFRAIPDAAVLYPSDAVSAERLVELAAQYEGPVYLRTSRPKTPIIYSESHRFRIGGSETLRSSPADRATVIAAGVTLHEALKSALELAKDEVPIRVIDLYSIKPVDGDTLRLAARETGHILTVEDHYPEGGLGDAVLAELAGMPFKYRRLAVNDIPRSGTPEELVDHYGISARAITKAILDLIF